MKKITLRENKFREFRKKSPIAKISSAKLVVFGPLNRENLFRENLFPRKFLPLRYVTNKRMLFHSTLCFPHRIKPGCLIRLLRIHFLIFFFFFLSFLFRASLPELVLLYLPLTAHWMSAVTYHSLHTGCPQW